MNKTQEFQALLYSCTQEGCPVCRLTQENTKRFLETWKYELFTDTTVRQELRNSQGFCRTHTWQLARLGAGLPLAQAYRDIISDSIEQLQRSNNALNGTAGRSDDTSASPGLLGRFFEGRAKRPVCPACHQQHKAETRYTDTLRKAILDETFYQQFVLSDGLCLDHFRLACEYKTSKIAGDWLSLLRKAQLTCLQRLDQQLGELIRKHDYRFKDEPRGPEMLSWKRAAGLVAGEDDQG